MYNSNGFRPDLSKSHRIPDGGNGMIRDRVLSSIHHVLQYGLDVRREEVPALFWSFLYFFSLLTGYYILRPIRDEMGIQGGVDNLPWMFTATFAATALAVPIFGWIVSRFRKPSIIPVFYVFFLLQLLLFYILFRMDVFPLWRAYVFFVWLSVFNLFVISVFWSFMVDLYREDQSRRLFGFIAAGGTAGAITGPAINGTLVELLSLETLFLLSAVLLLLAMISIRNILQSPPDQGETFSSSESEPHESGGNDMDDFIGGHAFGGFQDVLTSPYLLLIGLFIVTYTATSTFVYFGQAEIVDAALKNSTHRTQVFALMDFGTNALTLLFQILLTGRLMQWFGPGPALLSLPLTTGIGFLALAVSPVLIVLILFQIVRRASNYGLSRPGREVLFSPLDVSEKYKGKNVVDTLLYRGGDAVTGWIFSGLKFLGLSLSGIALVGALVSVAWVVIGAQLIFMYDDRSESS